MSTFPDLIKSAAETFANQTIGFAQLRLEQVGIDYHVKVRLQSLEIAKQFDGDVVYGKDPKGILFYRDEAAFKIQNADFKFKKYGSGDKKVIEIKFLESGGGAHYATFVSRQHLPAFLDSVTQINENGKGKWTDFKIASSQTELIRPQGSKRINMSFEALNKAAFFQSKSDAKIEGTGNLLFRDYDKLKSTVSGKKFKVQVSSSIFVFYAEGTDPAKDTIGLFIPAVPADVGASEVYTEDVTWEDIN